VIAEPPVLRLSPPQWAVISSTARFRVLIAGRRTGKTHLALVELFTAAWETDASVNWYVAPTYRQAKQLAWRPLKALIPREYVAAINEVELSITLVNGAVIALKGSDKPDSLRGSGLDFLVMDEFAWIDLHAWTEVLRPALSDRQGRALFITSPAGFNWAYDLFLKGQGGDADWASWQYTTIDGGRVPADEIEKAKADLDPRVFAQEYLASFEQLDGRVYGNFLRSAHPVGNLDPSLADHGGEIHVGLDFNVHPMSAVIGQRAGDEPQILDCIEIPTSNTEEMAAEIRRRYPERQVIVFPDPSGKSRRTSAIVGVTDFTILQRHGFTVRAPRAAPPVVDRVNNTQALLLAADGRRRLRIHPRAAALCKALEGLTYKEGTSTPDKSGGLDHLPDALGYWLWEEFNVLVNRDARRVRFAL